MTTGLAGKGAAKAMGLGGAGAWLFVMKTPDPFRCFRPSREVNRLAVSLNGRFPLSCGTSRICYTSVASA